MTTEEPQSGQPAGGPPPPPAPPTPPAAPPTAPAPGAPPAYGAQPPAGGTGESNGAAVTSLIFGILSWICLGPIAAIVAIITGVIGRKKTYQRGMATAGLWLGIINLVLSVIVAVAFTVMAIVGVGLFSEATKQIDSSLYDVMVTDCNISRSGVPTADFDITNLDSKTRSFLVTVEFESTNSSESTTSVTSVNNVAAGETKSGQATGLQLQGSDEGPCTITKVANNPLG
jgi:hypothetical protein